MVVVRRKIFPLDGGGRKEDPLETELWVALYTFPSYTASKYLQIVRQCLCYLRTIQRRARI